MTKLLWDKAGEKPYETGIDRGVLYLSDGSGVSWNGLTAIEEDFGGDGSTPRYFDGLKYSDEPSFGQFSATLRAFTFPMEFLEYEGTKDLGNGILVDGQDVKTFGLSYRTKIGDDVSGIDGGYKIHILYNLMATPGSIVNETLSDSANAQELDWALSSVPEKVSGHRPTAHIWFDSRYLKGSGLIEGLENTLYGTDTSDPRLPSIDELIDFTSGWDPRVIIPDSSFGLAELRKGLGDLTPSVLSEGFYVALSDGRLVQSGTPGLYQLT